MFYSVQLVDLGYISTKWVRLAIHNVPERLYVCLRYLLSWSPEWEALLNVFIGLACINSYHLKFHENRLRPYGQVPFSSKCRDARIIYRPCLRPFCIAKRIYIRKVQLFVLYDKKCVFNSGGDEGGPKGRIKKYSRLYWGYKKCSCTSLYFLFSILPFGPHNPSMYYLGKARFVCFFRLYISTSSLHCYFQGIYRIMHCYERKYLQLCFAQICEIVHKSLQAC